MRTKKKVSFFIDNFLVKGALKRSNHTGRLVKVVKRPTEVGDDGETDLYASVQEERWFPFSDSLAASLRWACVIVKPPRQVPALRHSRAEEVANMPHPGYGCPARNEDVCCCSNQSNVSTLA